MQGLLVAEALVSSRLVREEQRAGQRWSARLREENSQWRSHSCSGTCSSVKRLTLAWKPTEQQEVEKGYSLQSGVLLDPSAGLGIAPLCLSSFLFPFLPLLPFFYRQDLVSDSMHSRL